MRLDLVPDARQERDGKHSAQMLPELLKRFGNIDPPEGCMVEVEPDIFKKGQNPVEVEITDQFLTAGVERVEGDTYGHGFTMPDVAMGQLFQFVGRPVAEVQRA
jgi:hypothetical protein